MRATIAASVACLLLGAGLGSARQIAYENGSKSCANWTKEKTGRVEGGFFWPDAINNAWIKGFISGAGYATRAEFRKTDAELVSWMDAYCTAHPLESISDAARNLVNELSAKR